MRMDEPKPTKTPSTRSATPKLGNEELLVVPSDDVCDDASTVDQYADLSACDRRQFRQVSGQFRRDDLLWPQLSPIKMGEPAEFVGLEPTEIAVDVFQGFDSEGSLSFGSPRP